MSIRQLSKVDTFCLSQNKVMVTFNPIIYSNVLLVPPHILIKTNDIRQNKQTKTKMGES